SLKTLPNFAYDLLHPATAMQEWGPRTHLTPPKHAIPERPISPIPGGTRRAGTRNRATQARGGGIEARGCGCARTRANAAGTSRQASEQESCRCRTAGAESRGGSFTSVYL